MRKHAALAVFFLLCLFLLSGCGDPGQKDVAKEEGLLIGFAQIGSESGWRVGHTKSVEAAADAAHVRLMMADANQKQENEIRALRSFIAYNVDAIVFVPIVEDGWENVLQEAKRAKIPVILCDRQISPSIDPSLISAYVGADFYAEGVRAGEYLLRKADETGAVSLRVAELTGTPDSTPALQRASGFRDTIAGDPRIRIVDSRSGDFLRSKGKESMREILRDFPDGIDVLYSHNDAMSYGAIEALEEAGIRPGTDIIMISVDGEQEAIDLLKEGKLNCVAECTPMLGDLAVELAKKLAAGEAVPAVTHPAETVFTEWDDLTGLAPRGY